MKKKNYTGREWSDNRLARFQVGIFLALLFVFYAFNYETTSGSFMMYDGSFEEQEIDQLVEVYVKQPPKEKALALSDGLSEQPIIEEENLEIFKPESVPDLVEGEVSEEVMNYRPEQAERLSLPEPVEPEVEEIVRPETVVIAERMPLYPECIEEFESYEEQLKCTQSRMMRNIQKHLTYPVIARENGIEETVVASFIVNHNGEITDIKIERERGMGFDEAVENAVIKIPKMLSGEQNSRKVNVKMYVPVKFRLAN